MLTRTDISFAQQKCADCGRVLTREDIHTGRAEFTAGKLICVQCTKHAVNQKEQRSLPVRIALGACGVVLIVGLIFPSLFLLGLLLAGSGALLLGALGFTFSSKVRWGLGFCGVLALGISASGMYVVNAQKETRRFNAELAGNVEKVEQLLLNGQGIEASQRLIALRAGLTSKNGDNANPEAAALLQKLSSEVDTWFQQTYGVAKPADREMLQRLVMAFGEKTAGGSRRFISVKADGDRVDVSGILATETISAASGPHRDAAMEESSKLARFIANTQASIREIEITLLSDNAQHDIVSKVDYTPELLHRLKMSGANATPSADQETPLDPRESTPAKIPKLPPGIQPRPK